MDNFHIIGETTVFDLVNQYRLENLVDLEISQFTGLKDSTGKDIYEGDVYRSEIEYDHGDIREYYICTYINELGGFTWLSSEELYDYETLDFNEFYDMSHDFSMYGSENIKVIGNIYEKPKYKELNPDNEY